VWELGEADEIPRHRLKRERRAPKSEAIAGRVEGRELHGGL
jgi:hypothetical protein